VAGKRGDFTENARMPLSKGQGDERRFSVVSPIRVDQGLIPACADNVCLAHCIYFGNPDEIKKMILEKSQFNDNLTDR